MLKQTAVTATLATLLATPLAANAQDISWSGHDQLQWTCIPSNQSGCTQHPSNAYSPFWTHRPDFLPDVPASEKEKYTYTLVKNPGKEVCNQVGWQSSHLGWVPQGNAQVLTKWKEDHSGVACKIVGKVTEDVKKPVWMLLFSRDGKPVAAGLYADGAGLPMAKNGGGFTGAHSSPWMANAICENPEKFYGETALGPAGRMVNGHGYATLSTGERVPVTSFMVNYQKQTWVPTGIRNYSKPGKPQWRQPICEVLRYDLRYAPQFQAKYAQSKINATDPSGAKLVRQDY